MPALSGGDSSGRSQICSCSVARYRWLGLRVVSLRETSRLIADPLNCTLRLRVILHFFLTNFGFSLYTNKLKENLFGDNYWECPLYGIQCSSKCSRLHRSSDAKPEWDTLYMDVQGGRKALGPCYLPRHVSC
jgi:hypothetical protein